MPGMDMSNMPGMDMSGMGAMTGLLGAYPMTRDASGTSWQPDAAAHNGVHAILGDWSLMGHAMLTGVYDSQSGPRGGTQWFAEGMLMGAARRDFTTNDVLNLPPDAEPRSVHGRARLSAAAGQWRDC